jgi:hypothetical protein
VKWIKLSHEKMAGYSNYVKKTSGFMTAGSLAIS